MTQVRNQKVPDTFLQFRAICWECRRTSALCFCERIRKFELDPLLVLVVHPKEARNPVGTVRIVKLSVSNSVTFVGHGPELDENPELRKLLEDPSLFPVVLFPGPQSINLSQATKQQTDALVPAGRRLAILLIDGTWSKAKKLLRTSHVLASLPRISFDVTRSSNYRFRRQPRSYCLSTVEATHLLIENLHRSGLCRIPNDQAHDTMLGIFDWMVETQLAFNEPA